MMTNRNLSVHIFFCHCHHHHHHDDDDLWNKQKKKDDCQIFCCRRQKSLLYDDDDDDENTIYRHAYTNTPNYERVIELKKKFIFFMYAVCVEYKPFSIDSVSNL